MLQGTLTFPTRLETVIRWAETLVRSEKNQTGMTTEKACIAISRRAGLPQTTVSNLIYRPPVEVKDRVYSALAALVVKQANRQIESLINEREIARRALSRSSAVDLDAINQEIKALREKLAALSEG